MVFGMDKNEYADLLSRLSGELVSVVKFSANGKPQVLRIRCKESFTYYPFGRHPDFEIELRLLRFKSKSMTKIPCPYCARPLTMKSESDRDRLIQAITFKIESQGGKLVGQINYQDTKTPIFYVYEGSDFETNSYLLLYKGGFKPHHGKKIAAKSGKAKPITFNELKMSANQKCIKLLFDEVLYAELSSYEYRKEHFLVNNRVGSIYEMKVPISYRDAKFSITVSQILDPYFLPFNSRRNSEELCRGVFDFLFNATFIKVRPNWLVNPKTKRKLELDGYAEIKGVRIAFEHDGYHHEYKENSIRDRIKDEACEFHNVNLLRIPQLFEKTDFRKLPELIIGFAIKKGIGDLIQNREIGEFELKNIFKKIALNDEEKIISEVRGLAFEHGLEIKEFKYLNSIKEKRGLRVTLLNGKKTRQKTFYASLFLSNPKKVLHFFSEERSRDIVQKKRVINSATGEMFDSMASASRSIGKSPSYLQARLIIEKGKNRTKVKNLTSFKLID